MKLTILGIVLALLIGLASGYACFHRESPYSEWTGKRTDRRQAEIMLTLSKTEAAARYWADIIKNGKLYDEYEALGEE